MNHLEEQGINILKMDVTDDKSIVLAVETIIKEQGRIDVLVNNAGYESYGALEDVPMSEAKYQFEVNVFGMARLTQMALPYMRRNKFGPLSQHLLKVHIGVNEVESYRVMIRILAK